MIPRNGGEREITGVPGAMGFPFWLLKFYNLKTWEELKKHRKIWEGVSVMCFSVVWELFVEH